MNNNDNLPFPTTMSIFSSLFIFKRSWSLEKINECLKRDFGFISTYLLMMIRGEEAHEGGFCAFSKRCPWDTVQITLLHNSGKYTLGYTLGYTPYPKIHPIPKGIPYT